MTQNTFFDICNDLKITFSQLSFDNPIGFSQTTCFLASNAARLCSACNPLGVQIFTTSITKSDAKSSSILLKNGTLKCSAPHSSCERTSTIAINSASSSLAIISACLFPIWPAPTTANFILLSMLYITELFFLLHYFLDNIFHYFLNKLLVHQNQILNVGQIHSSIQFVLQDYLPLMHMVKPFL